MNAVYDDNLYARLLLTAVTAIYGIGLILADVNKTHVTNPLWTPHARFHVVWQIGSYTGFAGIAWFLLAGTSLKLDANTTVFSVLLALLVGGIAAISS